MHRKEASTGPYGCEQEGKNGSCIAVTAALFEPYSKIRMIQCRKIVLSSGASLHAERPFLCARSHWKESHQWDLSAENQVIFQQVCDGLHGSVKSRYQ